MDIFFGGYHHLLLEAMHTGPSGLLLCSGCGLEFDALSRDHIVASSRFAPGDPACNFANITLLCTKCNSRKSNMLSIEDLHERYSVFGWRDVPHNVPAAQVVYAKVRMLNAALKHRDYRTLAMLYAHYQGVMPEEASYYRHVRWGEQRVENALRRFGKLWQHAKSKIGNPDACDCPSCNHPVIAACDPCRCVPACGQQVPPSDLICVECGSLNYDCDMAGCVPCWTCSRVCEHRKLDDRYCECEERYVWESENLSDSP